MKKIVFICALSLSVSMLNVQAQEFVYGPGEAPSKDDIVNLLGGSSLSTEKKGLLGKKKAFCDDCGSNAAAHIYTSENQFKEPVQPTEAAAEASSKKKSSISMQIVFDLNSYKIQTSSFASLNALAEGLNSIDSKILISGHTDASGSAEHNFQLSQKRAEAVKEYLMIKGIDPSRLETRGMAANQLLDARNPYAGINRRVNFSAVN